MPDDPAPIGTPRMNLVALPLATMQALAAGDLAEADRQSGLRLPDGWAMRLPWLPWAAALAADPSRHPWCARAAVDRKTGEVVANIGFHGPPEAGTVEIGYTVEEPHRRRGLAVEAATGLLAWASAQPDVTTLRAATSPDNLASQAVLGRLGFNRDGEQMDEIDGLEWVFTRPPM